MVNANGQRDCHKHIEAREGPRWAPANSDGSRTHDARLAISCAANFQAPVWTGQPLKRRDADFRRWIVMGGDIALRQARNPLMSAKSGSFREVVSRADFRPVPDLLRSLERIAKSIAV